MTNVFVEAGGGTQAETGAYKVEGSWEFTATTVLDKNGNEVPVKGCYTQTLVDGKWTNKTWHDGPTYLHEVDNPSTTVRLVWRAAPNGMKLSFR